jgi:cytidylate kinase
MTTTTVVAISRQLGSGGAEIARALAERLQFRYADRDILRRAAETLGCEDCDVESLDERLQSIWETLAPAFWVSLPAGAGPAVPGLPPVTGTALFEAERRIIETLAATSDAVIVGRGAAPLLRGRPGVLTVFVHAREAARVERVAARLTIDQRAALDLVRRSDRDRAAFHQALCKREWSDATQYHVCIDTSDVDINLVTDVLVTAVQRLRDARGSATPSTR